jgi:hypothetical protein
MLDATNTEPGDMVRAIKSDKDGGLSPGSVYLVFQRIGWGLDLVLIAYGQILYVRALESELSKYFEEVQATDFWSEIGQWAEKRTSGIAMALGLDLGEFQKRQSRIHRNVSALTTEEINEYLLLLAAFEVKVREYENRAEFHRDFPNLMIDPGGEVRLKPSRLGVRDHSKVGKVIGTAVVEGGYSCLVRWSDGKEEDVDSSELENV